MQIFINKHETAKRDADALQKLSNYDYMVFSFERQEYNTIFHTHRVDLVKKGKLKLI